MTSKNPVPGMYAEALFHLIPKNLRAKMEREGTLVKALEDAQEEWGGQENEAVANVLRSATGTEEEKLREAETSKLEIREVLMDQLREEAEFLYREE